MDLVRWSVGEANRQSKTKSMGDMCPRCGEDSWKCLHGINSAYASAYNPGEYIEFICQQCGYSQGEEPC